jgi:hypothetical protein
MISVPAAIDADDAEPASLESLGPAAPLLATQCLWELVPLPAPSLVFLDHLGAVKTVFSVLFVWTLLMPCVFHEMSFLLDTVGDSTDFLKLARCLASGYKF